MRELRAGHVYVKLPHGGCVAAGPAGDFAVAGPDDVAVADGAGDAFAAALAVALERARSA